MGAGGGRRRRRGGAGRGLGARAGRERAKNNQLALALAAPDTSWPGCHLVHALAAGRAGKRLGKGGFGQVFLGTRAAKGRAAKDPKPTEVGAAHWAGAVGAAGGGVGRGGW